MLIIMVDQHKLINGKPEARLDFAGRLRQLRIPRGYRTARSMARALGIDENRYTRYERAEVEPDLQLIRRICGLLGVLPNDLLGHGEAGRSPSSGGFAEGSSASFSTASGSDGPTLRSAAWAVAQAVTQLRAKKDLGSQASPSSPLDDLQQASRIYERLVEVPFDSVGVLLRDPAVSGADEVDAKRLRRLLDEFVTLASARR